MKTRSLAASVLFVLCGTAVSEAKTLAGTLDCPAPTGSGQRTLAIEIDENMPLAIVNEEEHPAYYTPSHIRILLEPNGPALTIGRSSGRIVAVSAGGETVALGICSARIRV